MAVHVSFTVPANSQQAPLTGRNIVIGITFRDDDGDLIDVTGLTFIDLTIGSPNVRAETLTRQSIGFWHLVILLPANQRLTAFEVIMGTNAVSYQSQTNEDIVGTGFIWFDTSGSTSPSPSPVNATFGTVEYRENGIIAVPITFAEAVVAVKTVFKITSPPNNPLQGIDYILVGEATAYELRFTVPPNRNGAFQIAAVGDVLKSGTGVWDDVTATPLTVPYNTIIPRIIDFDVPSGFDLGSPVSVRVAYNTEVTGWHANNTITEDGIFEMEGANLGKPLPYKWVGTAPPDFNEAVPDDLSGTDWQVLATPPAGQPSPDNNFDADGRWHGENGQYFLIRFPDPQETGIFNLRERSGRVRGPVA